MKLTIRRLQQSLLSLRDDPESRELFAYLIVAIFLAAFALAFMPLPTGR